MRHRVQKNAALNSQRGTAATERAALCNGTDSFAERSRTSADLPSFRNFEKAPQSLRFRRNARVFFDFV
eukprot:5344437-Prymnesium_polylepis.1